VTRLLLLATTLSSALVLLSNTMWGDEKETVGSLAAKGFDVRGVSSDRTGTVVVAMQKGTVVFICVGMYVGSSDCQLQK